MHPRKGTKKVEQPCTNEPNKPNKTSDTQIVHGGQSGCHQTGTHAWCAVDPGDTHDKGEESLCVGEAA